MRKQKRLHSPPLPWPLSFLLSPLTGVRPDLYTKGMPTPWETHQALGSRPMARLLDCSCSFLPW